MTAATPWPTAGRAWWAVSLCCAAALLSYTDRLILGLLLAFAIRFAAVVLLAALLGKSAGVA